MSDHPDDPLPWRVLASRVLFEHKFFRLRQDHVRLPNGAEIQDYVVSENPPWVIVLAVTAGDEVVLIRQYRHGIGQVHFELPGGVVDREDQSLLSAAQRELLEETGYGGGSWQPLLTQAPNPANQSNFAHVFLAQGVALQRAAAPEETEEIRVHLVPVSELQALVEGGGFAQALCIAPVCKYLLSRR